MAKILSRHCVDCDKYFEPSQRICPNCGYYLINLEEVQANPPSAQRSNLPRKREDNYFGIASILIGLVGLFIIGIVHILKVLLGIQIDWSVLILGELILPTISLIGGGRGLARDKSNILSIFGVIISILSIGSIYVVIWYPFPWFIR